MTAKIIIPVDEWASVMCRGPISRIAARPIMRAFETGRASPWKTDEANPTYGFRIPWSRLARSPEILLAICARPLLVCVFILFALCGARADLTVKDAAAANQVIFDFTCFTTKHCSAHVPVDAAGAALTGAAGAPSTSALTVQGISGGQAVPISGNITNISGTISLPTGAATSALQTTGNTSLSSIDTKTPALGQAVAGSSSPVVLPAAQITTLTPTSTVNTWAAGTLGAMANYGTSPGAVLVPGINAFVTNTNANGSATSANSSPVVVASNQAAIAVKNNGGAYETVAASQTGQALGATGATGDYLSHCVIYPASTSPGVVTVFDNTNAAGTNVIAFAGGATSTSNLTPISVPVGAISTAGAWKVTTGANVSVACFGNFT